MALMQKTNSIEFFSCMNSSRVSILLFMEINLLICFGLIEKKVVKSKYQVIS